MIIHALGEDYKQQRSLDTSRYLHGDEEGALAFVKNNLAYVVILGSVVLLGLVMAGTLERRS